jgi:hypothetical protein
MSLDYARDHLAAAVRSLATCEDPLPVRVEGDDLTSLLLGTTIAAATSGEDVHLATLADLA